MLKIYNHKLKKVMELDIKDYLVGVVAHEMPALFESEALKAQSTVARTYSLNRIKAWLKSPSKEHSAAPLCTDPNHCQGWYSDEELKSRWKDNYEEYKDKIYQAVLATGEDIIYYQNASIDALYHSTCGGKTEDAKNVWGSDLPYLKSVTCTHCAHSPRYTESKEITVKALQEKLGVTIGDIFKIALNNTGRVNAMTLGNKTISGKDVRSLLALSSTWFTPNIEKIIFTNKGYGHGVGMCQYGADGLAKIGRKYKDIVTYYYKGVEVKTAVSSDLTHLKTSKGIDVLGIRFGIFDDPEDKKQKSRVVLDLSGPAEDYSANTLTNPNRIYIDIKKSSLTQGNTEIGVQDGLLNSIRISQFEPEVVRVVLDVKTLNTYKIFALNEDKSENPPRPYRLVIDVVRTSVTPTPAPTQAPTPKPTPAPTPAPTPTPKPLPLKGKHIVIDPGHGGKSPGAVGINNLPEKAVVLDISKRLRTLLINTGATVTMTRDSDVYLSLEERVRIANNTNAQIFVSIHNNAWSTSDANGLETYCYTGSSKGRLLAASIQREMLKALPWRDRGVKVAGFYVIRYTKMPAALAEIGFITNPTEGKALAQSTTRIKAAEALYKGILDYLT